ncbi:YbaB/EbfC family nucleoid-associated protein [Candidatus Pelagibacter sp.]|nr:YbaB/EbfC family nucleoid-associated protein [Candidatus Pelagibacter sp.]
MSKKPIIVFEGIEGTGKSHHIKKITNYLTHKKIKFIKIREPGGSENSEKIRNLILDNKSTFNKETDFTKILDKAKELETKMKESQEKIKNIQVEGTSGSNSVKVTLNGENEMIKINLSDEILKENKIIIEDLIVAAHNNAKSELKSKTSEEISKSTSGFGIPGFKWPL